MPEFARLIAAVVVLAGLDLVATVCLKEAALRRSPPLAMVGVGLFVVLAIVLYYILELAELTIVSLGWIVILQVAVVVVDSLRYGVHPGRIQAAAIIVAIIALVVAAAAPTAEQAQARSRRPKHLAADQPVAQIPVQRAGGFPTLEERLRELRRQRDKR